MRKFRAEKCRWSLSSSEMNANIQMLVRNDCYNAELLSYHSLAIGVKQKSASAEKHKLLSSPVFFLTSCKIYWCTHKGHIHKKTSRIKASTGVTFNSLLWISDEMTFFWRLEFCLFALTVWVTSIRTFSRAILIHSVSITTNFTINPKKFCLCFACAPCHIHRVYCVGSSRNLRCFHSFTFRQRFLFVRLFAVFRSAWLFFHSVWLFFAALDSLSGHICYFYVNIGQINACTVTHSHTKYPLKI